MKKHLAKLQPVIGFIVSLILIYFVLFRPKISAFFSGEMGSKEAFFGYPRLGFSDLAVAFSEIIIWPIVVSFFILILSLVVRAWRWQIIIEPVGKASFWSLFHATNVGYLLNNVLPLRAGEIIRGVVVARKNNLSVSSLISTVVIERVFDLGGLAIAFGIVFLGFPFPVWMQIAGGVIAGVILLFLIVAFILAGSTERLTRWQEKLDAKNQGFFVKLFEQVIKLIHGLQVVRNPRAMIHMTWSTLSLWAMYFVVMKLVLDAFSLTDGTYPLLAGGAWIQSAALTLITALGFSIPSAPGGIGTYHASVLLGMSWFEVPEAMGVIVGTTMHAFNYITLSMFGIIGVFFMKLKWSDLIKKAKDKET